MLGNSRTARERVRKKEEYSENWQFGWVKMQFLLGHAKDLRLGEILKDCQWQFKEVECVFSGKLLKVFV